MDDDIRYRLGAAVVDGRPPTVLDAVDAANELAVLDGAMAIWAGMVAALLHGGGRLMASGTSAVKYGQVLRALATLAPDKPVAELIDATDEIVALFSRKRTPVVTPKRVGRPAKDRLMLDEGELVAK